MRKVALHGSYYGDNFGDTLLVLEYIDWLKELEEYSHEDVFLPFASDKVRKLVSVSQKKGIRSIIASELVIFIGGGYLGEPPQRQGVWSYRLIVRHLSIAFLTYILRKPYIFIGVGAGPLSNKLAKKLTVFLCNNSKKLIVRDEESRDYLINYGVDNNKIDVTVDSVLTLRQRDVNQEAKAELRKKYKINPKEQILIGIHLLVSDDKDNKLKLILSDLKTYCNSLEEYKIVVFKDFHKENYDYLAYSMIKQEFVEDKVILAEYESPEYLIALIDELNVLVTTKLHCGIVANCLGKYTISLSAHNKTIRFYKQLGLLDRHVAFEEYCQGKLIDMLSEYNPNVEYYENVPENIRNLANKNKNEFLSFILNS